VRTVFFILLGIVVFALAMMVAPSACAAGHTELQPHLNAIGSQAVFFGWHERFQLVLPDINAPAIPWNVYLGGQQEWTAKNGSAISLEVLTGFKGCPNQRTTSGMLAFRTDGTLHTDRLFGLGDGWYFVSTDAEYYPRDHGWYLWWSVERLIWTKGKPGNGVKIGGEWEYYVDRNESVDLDGGFRFSVPFAECVKVHSTYFVGRQFWRVYLSFQL